MYPNMNKNPAIVCDDPIIETIKQKIQQGIDKIKSFVKSKKTKIEQYYELKEKFLEIATLLEKHDFLSNEFNYFLSIKNKILYIFRQNALDKSFGHYDFALKLFDLFIEIWDAKVQLIQNDLNLEEYEAIQKEFKKKYRKHRSEYLLDIQEYTQNYPEETIYNIHESLRE